MNKEFQNNHEYYKQQMPYQLSDEQWETLQEKIKATVLTTPQSVPQPTVVLPFWKKIIPLAAAVALPIVATFWSLQHHHAATDFSHQQLEAVNLKMKNVVNELNDQEMEYLYRLNENQLTIVTE